MVRMHYSVGLAYEVRDPTSDFIFNFHAAQTARQAVVTESLQLTLELAVDPPAEPTLLNRRLRVRAPKGRLSGICAAGVRRHSTWVSARHHDIGGRRMAVKPREAMPYQHSLSSACRHVSCTGLATRVRAS